jgi:signal transduction histidine kinase
MQALEPRSLIAAPLMVREQRIGTVTFVMSTSQRQFEELDVKLAMGFANRAALALENARLYREAQGAIAVRDEFLSIASHELKTPLTALKLQVQILQVISGNVRLPEPMAERLPRLLEVSDRQINRIDKLVDELLDVTRLNSGKLELAREPVNLKELVEETCSRLQGELSRVGCEATITSQDGIVGHWDRMRIEQVVSNLLTNAIKYAPGKPIEIEVAGGPGNASLKIRDHGTGIAESDQQRIFKRFERATSSANTSGLGLGLYIVSKIVRAHDGEIGIDSRPGKGATFTVTLPLDA